MALWKDRQEAGQQLAARLVDLREDSVVLLAVPRGGVPVAASVAQSLKLNLYLLPTRRLSIPWREENDYAYVDDKGRLYINQALAGQVRLTRSGIERIAHQERARLLKDLEAWGATPLPKLQGTTVWIVDDGMHSGWTMYSAVAMTRSLGARKIVAAVPVTHFRARRFLSYHCDEVVSLRVENIPLYRIEDYYAGFAQVDDAEIKAFLSAASGLMGRPAA
jgi:putative phosphoribosyl transferase